jgi:hypothetical protein
MSLDRYSRDLNFKLQIHFNQVALGKLIKSESNVIARFRVGTKFVDLNATQLEFSQAIWEGWTAKWDKLEKPKDIIDLMSEGNSAQLQLVGTDNNNRKFVARTYFLPEKNRIEAFRKASEVCF